jgi:hypothetical protein
MKTKFEPSVEVRFLAFFGFLGKKQFCIVTAPLAAGLFFFHQIFFRHKF